jgi:hypothetical protein
MQLLENIGSAGWVHVYTEPRIVEVEASRMGPINKCEVKWSITEDLINQIAELASKIPANAVGQPQTRQDVALNRYMRGSATQNPGDALLEYTIGLEATLLPSKFEGELGYRLRVNAAWLLGEDAAQRREIARKIGRAYNLRSALVHGLKVPKPSDLVGGAEDAKQILRMLLLLCLRDHWPTSLELNDRAFGV